MEAQQCVELTSTNRPFGLIIKLTQTVVRRRSGEFAIRLLEPYMQDCSTFGCEPNLYASHSVVADDSLRERGGKEIEADPMSAVFAGSELLTSRRFPVVISRGSHPFPSRTR